MVDAMRDSMAERGLGTIATAMMMAPAAQRAVQDRHGPVAAAGGPDDGAGSRESFRRSTSDMEQGVCHAGITVPIDPIDPWPLRSAGSGSISWVDS
jgi:hypothetical protein